MKITIHELNDPTRKIGAIKALREASRGSTVSSAGYHPVLDAPGRFIMGLKFAKEIIDRVHESGHPQTVEVARAPDKALLRYTIEQEDSIQCALTLAKLCGSVDKAIAVARALQHANMTAVLADLEA